MAFIAITLPTKPHFSLLFSPSSASKAAASSSLSNSSSIGSNPNHVINLRSSIESLKLRLERTTTMGSEEKRRSPKIVYGDDGYVLEDVPHQADYIPNLPTHPNPLQDNPAYSIVKQFFLLTTTIALLKRFWFTKIAPGERIFGALVLDKGCVLSWMKCVHALLHVEVYALDLIQ